MSLTPSFLNQVVGAGNGKGLEAAPLTTSTMETSKQKLSTANNSGQVSAIPAHPVMSANHPLRGGPQGQ